MKRGSEKVTKREGLDNQAEMTYEGPVYLLPANIYETENELVVISEMAGVDEKNVDISLEDRELSIIAHRAESETPEGYQLLHHGYTPGAYRRTFKIIADVDSDKIEAKIVNGVLRLVLPKAEKAKPKKIKVTA